MDLLLAADEYCCFFDGDYYVSETGLTYIKRYLMAFEKVTVAFRTQLVYSKEDLGKYRHKIGDRNVAFIPVPFFQGPMQFAKKYFEVMKVLKNDIKGCDFAILRLPSTTAFAALRIVRKHNIPYATEIVFDCQDAVETSASVIDKLIWKILHRMQVKACNDALGVACVTESYLQRRYFPKGVKSITSHYSSIELTPDFYFHSRKFPDKEVIRLVHVANQVQFNGRKGHNELIEVISKLNRHHKIAEIFFIGEDYNNGVAKLKELSSSLGIADSVHFTGYLSRNDLRSQLENSDIAVLPTRAEGLPRVVIEAMALGLPCITSPVSGNPELINSRFLIEYDDVDAMAEACHLLITNKSLYESESVDNFNKSKEYSNEILNERRTKFYKDLISIAKQ